MTTQRVHKRTVTLAIVAVAITASMLYVQLGSAEQQPANPNAIAQEKTRYALFVDWAGFDSMENMTRASTNIIAGKVNSIQKSITVGGIDPYTYYDVAVQENLKGGLKQDSVITFKQMGGIYSDQSVVADEVLLTEGQEYLFFLVPVPGEDAYESIVGPQGKFLIRDSKVYSMDYVDAEKANAVSLKAKGSPLTNFKDEVSTFVAKHAAEAAKAMGADGQ